jgi:hypothetical protein
MRWTPDGQSIVFAAADEARTGWRLMRVPAAGGVATAEGVDSARLRPDGRATVNTIVLIPGELWAYDNVLAALAGR